MELSTYLRRSKGVAVLLVLVPVAVLALSALFLSGTTEQSYRAALDVKAPIGTGAARDLDQAVDDLISVAGSPVVEQQVAEASGVAAQDLPSMVALRRVSNGSSYVRLAVTADSPEEAEAVARALAERATSAVLQPQIQAARTSVIALERQYAQLIAEPDTALTIGLPPEADQVAAERAAEARRVAEQEAAALGRPVVVEEPATPQEVLVEQKQELLLRAITDVNLSLVGLRAQLDTATALLEEAVTVREVSRQSQVLRGAVVNAGASLFLLVCLVAVWEVARGRRDRRPGAPVIVPQPAARPDLVRR